MEHVCSIEGEETVLFINEVHTKQEHRKKEKNLPDSLDHASVLPVSVSKQPFESSVTVLFYLCCFFHDSSTSAAFCFGEHCFGSGRHLS